MNKAIIAVLAVVLIAAGGAFALMSGKSDDDTATKDTPTSTTTTDSKPEATPQNEASTNTAETATITYTNSGFSPSTVTVKAGVKFTVKNNSSQSLQFDSDPHPSHTDDPELNIGLIVAGESKTITVTKTGKHGFHNHLNEDHTGTLVVE